MEAEGTVRIGEKTYPVTDASTWFDRQWAALGEGARVGEILGTLTTDTSWLWMGLPLSRDKGEAISLWDLYIDR